MQPSLHPLVGRERELRELEGALEATHGGRGGVWLLSGDPGIGKSRLVEELGRIASERGSAVLWGRCWEAGGAPAFWPWIQVLRALARRTEAARSALQRHARHLSQILPELGEATVPRGDEGQARFQLLESIATVLCDAAGETPIVVMLEDVHGADPSSVAALETLSAQARSVRLLVVGTYRDPDARRSPVAASLGRVARSAQTLTLPPLGSADVERYLGNVLGPQVQTSLVEAVQGVAEGNPLFVVELARWLQARGGDPGHDRVLVVPRSLRALMDERLGQLSPPCRQVLEAASVLGRDFTAKGLEGLGTWDATDVAGALHEATDAAVLVEVSPTEFRFGHAQIRERLYGSLETARREGMHAAVADRLSRLGGDPAWSEIAHHLLHAGEARRARAIEAARCAGERALGLLAFDEAAVWFQRALDSASGEPASVHRAELLLALGHAQIHAGDVDAGRRACLEVADAARATGDAALLGRAALEFGGVFLFALVDSRLITILEEAIAAQGTQDSSLRARLMARLAAARQPAPDPQGPIELARKAVEMARRLDDAPTLLATMRSACSALMDLGDPEERRALNREYVDLAASLDSPAEALRGLKRLIFDCCELGDARGAHAAALESERIAKELDSPHAAWPVAGIQAMLADWEGRFDDAEKLAEIAGQTAARARDPNARTSLTLQRLNRLGVQGRLNEALDLIAQIRPRIRTITFGEQVITLTESVFRIAAGRTVERGTEIVRERIDGLVKLGDLSLLEAAGEICVAQGLTAEAERVYERLLPHAGRFASWGHLGMYIGPPAARILGIIALALERSEDGLRHLKHALERCRTAGAAPQAALIALDLARGWMQAGPEGRAHAIEWLDVAAADAERLGMGGLAARVAKERERLEEREGGPQRPPAPEVPRISGFRLRADGEQWAVECEDTTFRLQDSKGVRLLARLVAEPGREFHVLDLTHAQGSAAVDRGDAGEVVDAKARNEYRRRAAELREELDEATSWNDAARAERIRTELEFLESEMSRVLALGGRSRRASSAAERARINVQRRIRDAIRRISKQHTGLGRHLEWAVRTGIVCSYDPR